jgi:hypothetical protein
MEGDRPKLVEDSVSDLIEDDSVQDLDDTDPNSVIDLVADTLDDWYMDPVCDSEEPVCDSSNNSSEDVNRDAFRLNVMRSFCPDRPYGGRLSRCWL